MEERCPDAARVVPAMDRLKARTRWPAATGRSRPSEAAGRIARGLEIHPTPEHGSWLNGAEIELGVPARRCPDERLADRVTPARQVAARERDRTPPHRRVDRRCTTAAAGVKPKRLYPQGHRIRRQRSQTRPVIRPSSWRARQRV